MELNNITNNKSQAEDLSALMSNLKTRDYKYSRMSKGLQVMYFILIPVYILLTILELSKAETFDYIILVKGCCFVASMSIFAFIFTKYQKEYRNVDYSEPTLIMLKKAAKRYHPFRKETLWALLAVVTMDIGLNCDPTFGNRLDFQLTFWIMMIVAVAIGLTWWHFRYRPLRDKAKELIREIENG